MLNRSVVLNLINRNATRLLGAALDLAESDNDALSELLEAEDTVGTGRQRIREEQGWAAFKRQRDRGYQAD